MTEVLFIDESTVAGVTLPAIWTWRCACGAFSSNEWRTGEPKTADEIIEEASNHELEHVSTKERA